MTDFPHATFRIEMAPGKRLGPGKIRLLELVAKTGISPTVESEPGLGH